LLKRVQKKDVICFFFRFVFLYRCFGLKKNFLAVRKEKGAQIGVGEWATLRPVEAKHQTLADGVKFNVETTKKTVPQKLSPVLDVQVRMRKVKLPSHSWL
jgi:hypothetical protein